MSAKGAKADIRNCIQQIAFKLHAFRFLIKWRMLKEYRIDGSKIRSLENFYDQVGDVIIQSSDWGRNLDAFNDILYSGLETPQDGFIIRWSNSGISKNYLGYIETEKQLRLRLANCHLTNRQLVSDQIALAMSKEGPTVFDWLLEIINRHGPEGDEKQSNVVLILE